jgi:predicted enzyme related to lactoylglutathione lyase
MEEKDWARPVVHWELVAKDASALGSFYRQMFNWEMPDGPALRIPAGIGGPEPGPGGTLRTGDRPGLSLYIQVRDLQTSMAKAESLGGKVLSQPMDVPGGPTIAGILDPEGNRIMLVQQ